MAKPKKLAEELKHTILIIDAYLTSTDEHSYSIYVDNNLEVEAVEELASDAELPLLFDLVNESIEIKHVQVEDPNVGFFNEVFFALPEEAQDFWDLLTNNAVRVDKGVWRVNKDLALD